VAGDFVFVLTNDSEMLALTRADGRIRWATALPRYTDPEDRAGAIVWAGPVVAGGRVLAVGSDGYGVVVSAETGEVTNRFEIDGGGSTVPPAVAGGMLFVIADDGTLIAYR
jgi:outer membrane protein assembly factor BamB